jgi:hypothetical protein
MKYINGIPLRQDTADGNLMSVLTEGESAAFTAAFTDAANEGGLFTDSPFGESWDSPLILEGDDPAPQQQQLPPDNYWLYHLYTDTDGAALIEQYKKDAPFGDYKGQRGDGVVDINVYYEKDNEYNYFGSVCFVKMNKSLRSYISERSTYRSPAWLAAGIVNDNKSKAAAAGFVPLNEEALESAIEYELNKNSLINRGASYLEKYMADQLHGFAENMRSQKYEEVRWNPGMKDYDPLIKNLSSLTEAKERLESFAGKQGEYIGDFWKLINSLPDVIRMKLLKPAAFISDLWAGVLDIISFIINILDKIDLAAEAVNAFICGAVNQLYDTAAAVIDLIAAIPYIADREKRLIIEETLENAVEKFFSEGFDIKARLRKFWDALTVRYDSDKPSWLIAYQLGEDAVEVILWIDLVKGIIDIIRSLPKIFKGFKNWAENIIKKGINKDAIIIKADDLIDFIAVNGLKLTEEEIGFVINLVKGKQSLVENILLSTKEIIEGKSISELMFYFKIADPPILHSLSNYQARIWYTFKKLKIDEVIESLKTLEEKAHKAFDLRNEYRSATRNYMKDRKLAEYLEEVEKNIEWEEYIKFKGKTFKGDDLWNEIIKTSQKGRDNVDKLFKLK